MSDRRLIAVFESERDLLAAVRHLRQEGIAIADVQTPYAVHKLDEAAGLPRSRLGWVCAIAGLGAAAAMLGFQLWVSAAAWPINVGGKPFASTPAFVPVMFEVGVLAAGLTTVLAFLIVSRLYPGRPPQVAHPGVTDDRFVVVVEAPGAGPERQRAADLCRQHHALEAAEQCTEEGSLQSISARFHTGARLNIALLILLALLMVLNWKGGHAVDQRGRELLPEMVRSVAAESFSANPALAGGMTLQTPPEGSISRGHPPLRLTATPEDALRAGLVLESPFEPEDRSAAERGELVFSRYCALCHGLAGAGDGSVAQRGFPAPPSLLAPHAREMADGQVFHVLTFGQGNMPSHAAQLSREDRWRAVLHVRELQRAQPPVPADAPDPATVANRGTSERAADAADSAAAGGATP